MERHVTPKDELIAYRVAILRGPLGTHIWQRVERQSLQQARKNGGKLMSRGEAIRLFSSIVEGVARAQASAATESSPSPKGAPS